MFKKNTAVTGFSVGLVASADGSDITTGTPIGYYTLDGSTQTAIGDVTPVHEGNGLWTFDLLAAEMNGDIVSLTFTHASAITVHFTIKTDTKIVSELQDITTAQVNTEVDTGIIDAALATAASLLTAQADLDIITGASGVVLLTATQASIDAIEVDTSITLQAELDAIQAAVITNAAGVDIAADIIAIKAETALVVADTSELQGDWANGGRLDLIQDIIAADTTTDIPALISALNDLSITDVLTTQMTEAYAADGTAPTLAQCLFMIQQVLGEFAISGTTITVKKLDGTTTAATFTLDSSTAPTSSTRST